MPAFSSRRYFRILSGLAALLAILALPGAARASLDESRFTDQERVGLAFAKLTGTAPDFGSWILAEDAYQQAPVAQRALIMQSELARLGDGLTNYDPKVDLIHAVAKVQVGWNPNEAGLPGTHDITVAFLPPGAIFTYHLGQQRIDVMPEQIENRITFELKPEDFDSFAAQTHGGLQNVLFELYLQPVAADAAHPVQTGGETTWPMIARVAHMALWSSDHQRILWSFDAPWYQGSEAHKLLDLYNR